MMLDLLVSRQASYHRPVSSSVLARVLNVCPSYARELARLLVEQGRLGVRKGPGGGYYVLSPGPSAGEVGAAGIGANGEPARPAPASRTVPAPGHSPEAGDGPGSVVERVLRELDDLDLTLDALRKEVADDPGPSPCAARTRGWRRSLDELQERVNRVRSELGSLHG